MLRIGDFSQLAQISVRTLRLYDEMGLLKPAHIDRFTDYRYYTVEQLPKLNRILALKDLGLSLEQIKRVVAEAVPLHDLQEMLARRQTEIDQQLREEQARLARVRARLQQIAEEGSPPAYDVVLKKVEPLVIAGARAIVPTYAEMPATRYSLLNSLYDWLDANGIKPMRPELALYHEPEYKETDLNLEQATAVDAGLLGTRLDGGPVSVHELPGTPQAASLVHSGPFWGVPGAIVALFGWIGRHNFASAGAIREYHLFGRELSLGYSDAPEQRELQGDNPKITVELLLPVENSPV